MGNSGGKNEDTFRKWRRLLATALLILLSLAAAAITAAALYWNSLLNRMGTGPETVPSVMTEQTETVIVTEQTQPPTAPEDTWPVVQSDEAITNIMLIGQNHELADTMILCSVNRETKTLTMVSFLRDLYLSIPAYAGHSADRNRINTCYYWGRKWTGKAEGGMELLALCVEQNFGIPVDHSLVVDFEVFTRVIDAVGGVEVELTEKEAKYLTGSVGYVGAFEPGIQTLNGTEALAYSRIRKIDSDIQRTERQRTVLRSLAAKFRGMGLMQLHGLACEVLPMITTDMSNQELTGYLWEFLPMLKELEIRSVTCPVDNETLTGSRWDKQAQIGGTLCDVIECNTRRNREYLTEFLGLGAAEA